MNYSFKLSGVELKVKDEVTAKVDELNIKVEDLDLKDSLNIALQLPNIVRGIKEALEDYPVAVESDFNPYLSEEEAQEVAARYPVGVPTEKKDVGAETDGDSKSKVNDDEEFGDE